MLVHRVHLEGQDVCVHPRDGRHVRRFHSMTRSKLQLVHPRDGRNMRRFHSMTRSKLQLVTVVAISNL